MHTVSRLVYFSHYKIDPGPLKVLHKCDNPPCCNPNHLFLGAHIDNMKDRDAKGRNANFKYSDSLILEIRNEWENSNQKYGTITKLSTIFNMKPGIIRKILKDPNYRIL